MLQFQKYIIGGLTILSIISLIISIWLPIAESFRIVFGSVYVLFLPGLVLSYVFFNGSTSSPQDSLTGSPRGKEIDIIERITLSFALSIAVVPLLVFYLNLIGMKINVLNTVLTIALIIAAGLAIIFWQNKKSLVKE